MLLERWPQRGQPQPLPEKEVFVFDDEPNTWIRPSGQSASVPCDRADPGLGSLGPASDRHAVVTTPLIREFVVVEVSSHMEKRFLFNCTTRFSTKGLGKFLYDFT